MWEAVRLQHDQFFSNNLDLDGYSLELFNLQTEDHVIFSYFLFLTNHWDSFLMLIQIES